MGPAFDFVGIMTRRDYEKRNLNWKISVGILISGKNTLYGIDMTEVSECELIYQKY